MVPIENFSGNTFVAFMDISGFKQMMKGDGERALEALNEMYTAGYVALNHNRNVDGFFISDCGILFVNNNNLDAKEQIKNILEVAEEINHHLIEKDVMLTTSIAHGVFRYRQRIESPGVVKNPIYGKAYVDAFRDSETGTPRIKPGQCRIVVNSEDGIYFYGIDRLKKIKNHHYYYWMVNNRDEIDYFNQEYKAQSRYEGKLSVLKKYSKKRKLTRNGSKR
jgi:hypothetical protein